jgi:tyrosyl-tRNA synthetase
MILQHQSNSSEFMRTAIDFLHERGFIDQTTDPNLGNLLKNPISFYWGIDPTAPSPHLGNFVGIIASMCLQKFGHRPVILVGGATGLIGDPSGKDKERPLLTKEQIEENVRSLEKILSRFLDFNHPTAKPIIVNNYDWFSKITMIDFLRDVGKQFRVGTMMGKDSVRTRLSSEEGMSFTEFAYQVLQGYDFAHLNKELGVVLEIGGSDQYGNIVAGIDFTRRVSGNSVYGLTFPLLTRSDGKKFGKSEKGAIWLSEEMCSSFDLYQYLYKIPDKDVIHMLSMLTLMEMNEIRAIQKSMQEEGYIPNTAQKRLAEEVVRIIHGEVGLEKAIRTTEVIAPGKMHFDENALLEIAKNIPNVQLKKESVLNMSFVDIAVTSGLVGSKGEAKRLIQNQGAYLNGEKVIDLGFILEEKNFLKGNLFVLSSGKKKSLLVELV